MAEDITEQMLEDKLVELMKDEPMKVAQWMLVQFAKEAIACNAAILDMNEELTLGNIRYKLMCHIKLKKVNQKQNYIV